MHTMEHVEVDTEVAEKMHRKLDWQAVGAKLVHVSVHVCVVGSHMQYVSARQAGALLYKITHRLLHDGDRVLSHVQVGSAAHVDGSIFWSHITRHTELAASHEHRVSAVHSENVDRNGQRRAQAWAA